MAAAHNATRASHRLAHSVPEQQQLRLPDSAPARRQSPLSQAAPRQQPSLPRHFRPLPRPGLGCTFFRCLRCPELRKKCPASRGGRAVEIASDRRKDHPGSSSVTPAWPRAGNYFASAFVEMLMVTSSLTLGTNCPILNSERLMVVVALKPTVAFLAMGCSPCLFSTASRITGRLMPLIVI